VDELLDEVEDVERVHVLPVLSDEGGVVEAPLASCSFPFSAAFLIHVVSDEFVSMELQQQLAGEEWVAVRLLSEDGSQRDGIGRAAVKRVDDHLLHLFLAEWTARDGLH
jgi:hypothetical protein